MFKLEFETDNAAFEEDKASQIEHIIATVAQRIHDGETRGLARDTNGNVVGQWSLT